MKKLNRAMQKLENNYVEFRESMIKFDSNDVYDFAYKIYCIEEIYEFLTCQCELTNEMIRGILEHKGNILLYIYSQWLDYETSQYDEFCRFMESELKSLGIQENVKMCA